ncbi:MAG: site-specific DNA-methyltransferase [Myxococcales bacterium]|nr:site-specific DNA-methyltransferase [Myxococcales bacterium]
MAVGSLFPSGRLCALDPARLAAQSPQPFYEHPGGTLLVGDALKWLASLAPGSVDLIFADPPYNLGKAAWDEFDSHDEYLEWSLRWIALAARALADHGSLYVCGFSEILADLRRPAAAHFAGCRWLIWHYKNKANLTKDWGRSHESILHFRKSRRSLLRVDDVRVPYGAHTLKYPVHPQADSSQFGDGARYAGWRPNPRGAKPRDVFEIPVTSNGMAEKTPHPTQKPEELLRRLILGSSDVGQLVVDPFAGSGTTLLCAQQLGRRFLGCELETEYCGWAVARIERSPERSVADWIAIDRQIAQRREGIRGGRTPVDGE